MVVNVKLKNTTTAVPRGKFGRVNSAPPKTKTKTKSLARVVAPASSDVKNGSAELQHGGRIHAQRKFAQGANVGSPAATPVKSRHDDNRLRKRVISPTPPFPASKRPKTEDFLAFLCFRGTPVMPPDLDFFNYSSMDKKELKPVPNGNKAPNEYNVSQGSFTTQNSSNSKKEKSPSLEKAKINTSQESKKEDNSSKTKTIVKQLNVSAAKSKPAAATEKSNTASKTTAAVKKETKRSSNEKTSNARLNEQDARFAMTALKLKYQEKRLAQSKSAISKITKKVKERSVILTRSKAKSENSPSKSPTLVKQKVIKKKTSNEAKKVQPRNVPSPDIIYAVNHNKSKMVKHSESEKSSSSSSSSTSSSSESEESEAEPVVKSLRSGNKSFVVKPNRARPIVRKIPTVRRMGTRAMQRTSKSPLRELPMYTLKKFKRRKLAKKVAKKEKCDKSKSNIASKRKSTEKSKTKADSANNKLKEKGKIETTSKIQQKFKERKNSEVSKAHNKGNISSNKDRNGKPVSKPVKKVASKEENSMKKNSKKSESESESEEESSDDDKISKYKPGNKTNQKVTSKPNLKLRKDAAKKPQSAKVDIGTKGKITKKNEESDEEPTKPATTKVAGKTPEKKANLTKSDLSKKAKPESINKNAKKCKDDKSSIKQVNAKSQKESNNKNLKSKTKVIANKSNKSSSSEENEESTEKSDSESEEESDQGIKAKSGNVANKQVKKGDCKSSNKKPNTAKSKNEINKKNLKSKPKAISRNKSNKSESEEATDKSTEKSDSESEVESDQDTKTKSGSLASKQVKKVDDKSSNKKPNTAKSQNEINKSSLKSKPKAISRNKSNKSESDQATDKSTDNSSNESEEESNESASPSKSSKLPKESTLSDSFGRPMRKTREAAEIYMGLLNKDFSSDEDVLLDKKKDVNSDESGNTSSSETKFLERQYHASLKRIEQKGKGRRTQSNKNLKSATAKSKNKLLSSRATKEKSPEKRILRSQRTHSEDILPQQTLVTRQRKSSSPSLVARRRISLPLATCDRRKEGAVRKSASICPRRPADFSYSSSGSDHDTSTSEDSLSNSDSDEKALAKNTEEIKRRSLEMKRKGKKVAKGQSTSDSDVNTSSDGGSQPVKASATLSKPRNISAKRRTSTTSVGEDSKNIATEMRRLVEQKRAVEAGNIVEEKPEQDTEMEVETDHAEAERSFSADDEQESTSESSRASSSSSSSSRSDSEDEIPAKPPVEKSSIAIQVDLDLEDIEAAAAIQNSARITEISATVTHMTHAETSTSTHTHTHTTQHSHIDLGYGPPPEMPILTPPPPPPFIPSYPAPDFYQTLHLTPPMVSSLQMVGQGSQDFVSTHHLGIPVSIPIHPSLVPLAPRVMAPNPLCFSTTSITTAATLQTHIRSVAANLDIPLVRPIVGADSPMNVPLPLPRGPHCHMPSLSTPMTRPLNFWSHDGRTHHYSAFRVPLPAGKIIQQQNPPLPPISCSSTMGAALPLSIVHPQHPNVSGSSQMHHQNLQQHRLPINARSVQPMASDSVRSIVPPSSSAPSHGFSILQNLPNVSIVPRFDRNSKTVVLPPQLPSSSRHTKESKKEKIKKEKPEGKKRRKIIIPQPPSPLTVRKDSTTPATYVKRSNKCHHKEREAITDPKESKSDPFNKLLQMKKECISEGEQTIAIQRSSSSTPEKTRPVKVGSSKDKIYEESVGSEAIKKLEKISANSTSCNTEEFLKVHDGNNEKQSTKELKMQEVPSFYPDEDDFQDPLKYIEQIREKAEMFGMAKIVPPRSFRPECNVEDDMRFTAYNHYIHKMFKRWGPNVHETAAIKEHLRKSDVDMSSPPLLGGMEVDVSTLYHTVQSFGGLKEVIEKQKWHKVSDAMHFPKAANDRATKLDAIYVKYVLPFEMLSENERKKLMSSVESQWTKRVEKQLQKEVEEESDSESDEDPMQEFDDCVVKGKNTPLSSYFRVARNTFSMLFQGKEPIYTDVESDYWKMVREGSRHLCVYSGSIDCAGVGWGFPLPKAGAKHPWNLKVLANSQGSALRSMSPVMGATVPTLHVAMVFTTYCWYRDPHSLSWIEYLHSGANKIWYSIPGFYENEFRKALKELMPLQCKNKRLWLASDSAMVPPEMLLSRGVPVARAVQKPGEFLVVFPKTFTSAICTGYLVSESVCFAPPAWLSSCIEVFKDIRESKEPPVFGLEKLLISILTDNRASSEVLQMALPLVELIIKEELALRKKLLGMGLQTGQMGPNSDKVSKKKTKREEEHVHQCDVCNYILHLSIITNKTREFDLCLPHAIQHFHKTKSHIKGSSLLFDHTDEDLENIVQGAKNRLEKRSS